MSRTQDPSKQQRIKPSHRGQGEAELLLPVRLRYQDACAVLAELDQHERCAPAIIEDLESLLTEYVHWVIVGRFDVRLPQQKAALEKIQKNAPKLAQTLTGLDPDVAYLLQRTPLPSQFREVTGPELIGAIALELNRMAGAAAKQLEMARFHKRGPSPQNELLWIYNQLMQRFVEWSRHKISFHKVPIITPDGKPTSQTEAGSPATRFIEAVFKALHLGSVYDAADLPPSEWPNFYFRNGHEGGMEWQGSTSRKISLASCVKRRSCWRRAERLQMPAGGSALPNKAITAGARSTAD